MIETILAIAGFGGIIEYFRLKNNPVITLNSPIAQDIVNKRMNKGLDSITQFSKSLVPNSQKFNIYDTSIKADMVSAGIAPQADVTVMSASVKIPESFSFPQPDKIPTVENLVLPKNIEPIPILPSKVNVNTKLVNPNSFPGVNELVKGTLVTASLKNSNPIGVKAIKVQARPFATVPQFPRSGIVASPRAVGSGMATNLNIQTAGFKAVLGK